MKLKLIYNMFIPATLYDFVFIESFENKAK